MDKEYYPIFSPYYTTVVWLNAKNKQKGIEADPWRKGESGGQKVKRA